MEFVTSKYDKMFGEAMVEVRHLGQSFFGYANAHPEEKNPSEYAGCQYAEIRAEIEALKYERSLAKAKSDAALEFVRRCADRKEFNKEDPTAKAMYKELNTEIKIVNRLTDEINKRLEDLHRLPARREVVLNAMEAKHADKDKQSV